VNSNKYNTDLASYYKIGQVVARNSQDVVMLKDDTVIPVSVAGGFIKSFKN
jgi:hypothetical protein